jgi:hypothetical protein
VRWSVQCPAAERDKKLAHQFQSHFPITPPVPGVSDMLATDDLQRRQRDGIVRLLNLQQADDLRGADVVWKVLMYAL